MADVTGLQILDLTNGGSANNGEDTFIAIKLSDGTQEIEQTFFIAHDKLPIIIMGLVQFGAMSRNTRLSRDPKAEADGQFAAAHALRLNSAFHGISLIDKSIAVLTLQASAPKGLLNFYLAADVAGLTKLQKVCEEAIQSLQTEHRDIPGLH